MVRINLILVLPSAAALGCGVPGTEPRASGTTGGGSDVGRADSKADE